MRHNRSIPKCAVIPELAYPDVGEAAAWLCAAFAFDVRLRIGNHRIQLNVGDGAVVLVELHGKAVDERTHSVMVRVADAESHHENAKRRGAKVLRALADYPYGERQYTAQDPAGHVWTFTESIADVEPEAWGGTSVRL